MHTFILLTKSTLKPTKNQYYNFLQTLLKVSVLSEVFVNCAKEKDQVQPPSPFIPRRPLTTYGASKVDVTYSGIVLSE